MILLRIDPVVLTLLMIALFALWVVIGYVMGFKDATEGAFDDYEKEV